MCSRCAFSLFHVTCRFGLFWCRVMAGYWIQQHSPFPGCCRSLLFSPATVTRTKVIKGVGISPVKTWLGKNKAPVHLSVATTRLHNENKMSASRTQRTNFHDISHDARVFFVPKRPQNCHNNTSSTILQGRLVWGSLVQRMASLWSHTTVKPGHIRGEMMAAH